MLSSCNVVTNNRYGLEWTEYIVEEGCKINVPVTFNSFEIEFSEGWYYDLLQSLYPEWSHEMVVDFHNMSRDDFENIYPGILNQEIENRISYVYSID